jgi:(1->4)-alpha-D-glucan 1-alpha-D-glucosylmutase
MGLFRPDANPMWWDVLARGPRSRYAGWFDIDWDAGPLVVPVLGSGWAEAVEELRIEDGELRYYEHRFPIAPGTGDGSPREVHERQHYRLVYWREANERLNYRRFFAVTELAGVRVEDPAVFEATHAEILRWVERGDVDGIRIDHPDGLRDPDGYLKRLRERAPAAWLVVEKILEPGEALPARWPVDGTTGYDALGEVCGLFIDPAGEPVPERGWAAEAHDQKFDVTQRLFQAELHRLSRVARGTDTDGAVDAVAAPGTDTGNAVDTPTATGTDRGGTEVRNSVDTLAVPRTDAPRTDPGDTDPEETDAAGTDAGTAVDLLAAAGIGAGGTGAGDAVDVLAAPGAVEAALAELAANFDVYRTYLPYGRERFDHALAETLRRRPELRPVLDALMNRLTDPADELCVRFQQLTGAVMAKGVEDTAMYRWNRFIALNEVGGDPSRFAVEPEEFHAAAARRLDGWPGGMTTLSTHDTKRGEDVRARLAVLSEIPAEWAAVQQGWRATAALPDPSFEDLLWQTVVGVWPIGRDRLQRYFVKAAREANRFTSWDRPDEAFEAAFHAVVDLVFDDPDLRHDVETFARRITPFGWSNALGQKLVQLTMPGIPDVYQGTELWEDSLVDPDNRRPVDFAERRDLLAALDTASGTSPVDVSGVAKLLLVSRALRLRRDRPSLFQRYHPVPATGAAAHHVVAFDRGGALSVATRLPVGLAAGGGWRDTELELPDGAWTDALTGRPVGGAALADILDTYPVALLVRG